MTLRPADIELPDRLPELPRALPIFELSAPSLEERRPAIDTLGKRFELGKLRTFELDHGTVMAGKRGEIEFFRASGAVWARDATATARAETEERDWAELEETDDRGERQFVLGEAAAGSLLEEAREILEAGRMLSKEMAFAGVELDQVAQLDERGKETRRGAGSATVKFLYELEGLPVRGAGAKTLLFADPEGKQARFSGAFHAWRSVGEGRTLKLPTLEEALDVGVLRDPELIVYHERGHTIAVTRLEFGYLALPAFISQQHLFPVFQLEGTVSEGERGQGFQFGRFHHAAPAKAYAKADLDGWYLSINPDGISAPETKRSPSR